MVSSSRSTSTQDLRRNVLDVELMPATAATYEKERFLYGGGYQNEERVVDTLPPWRNTIWRFPLPHRCSCTLQHTARARFLPGLLRAIGPCDFLQPNHTSSRPHEDGTTRTRAS